MQPPMVNLIWLCTIFCASPRDARHARREEITWADTDNARRGMVLGILGFLAWSPWALRWAYRCMGTPQMWGVV
jgi:hypothetical protein